MDGFKRVSIFRPSAAKGQRTARDFIAGFKVGHGSVNFR